MVPSDVIVGLVLLRKRQQLLRLRTIHQVKSVNHEILKMKLPFYFQEMTMSTKLPKFGNFQVSKLFTTESSFKIDAFQS